MSKANKTIKTLILGASTNTNRYAYLAAQKLNSYGFDFIPVGIKKGDVLGFEIINDKALIKDIHTITLYIGPAHQKEWYDYILSTLPQRIIFNPGTENDELQQLAKAANIEVVEGCTLVMLASAQY